MTIEFTNPGTLHAPAGAYSHSAVLPPGARTLLIAGQVGIRPDGSLAASLSEQADQVFRNIGAVLEAHGMAFSDIVKMTTYVVAGQDGAQVRTARMAHMGEHRPTATFIYVPQLFLPEWLLEIEAMAVRA